MQTFFPNVGKLLSISPTPPVTNSPRERSFSAMRHLKTYFGEQRLTNLTLLSIYLERSIDKDSVLNEYAATSNTVRSKSHRAPNISIRT